MKKPNFFIVFIGLDGSGKTSLARAAQEIFASQGRKVKYVWGAYDLWLMRPLVKGVKKILVKEKPAQNYRQYLASTRKSLRFPLLYRIYSYFVFAEYWLEILIKISLPLWLGRAVVADRYIYDTAVNRAANLNFSFEQFDRLIKGWLRWAPRPQRIYYVEVAEELAIKRKTDIPDLDYLRLRKKYYQYLAGRPEVVTLNGAEDLERLKQQLKNNLALD